MANKIYTLYQMTIDGEMWETTCKPLSTFSDLADANEEMADNMLELRKKGYEDTFGSVPDVSKYIPNDSKVVNGFRFKKIYGKIEVIYFVVESQLH